MQGYSLQHIAAKDWKRPEFHQTYYTSAQGGTMWL